VYIGFFSIEEFPSPKLQFRKAGDPPVLLSLNNIVKGSVPEVTFEERAATGGFKLVTVI
jgi:hypothetical protein